MKSVNFTRSILLGLLFLGTELGLAQVELAVADVKGAAGAAVVVPILVSEGKNIAALQFTLAFDSSILSIPGDDSILAGSLLADHSIGADRRSGRLTVVVFSSSFSSLKPGRGTVMNVVLQLARGTANGSLARISLSDVRASDIEGNTLNLTTRDGSVTVSNDAAVPTTGANELIFPHIVNGSLAGGSFVTALIFVNRTGVPTGGEVRFFRSDGSAMPVRLSDGQSGSSFSFSVAEGGSVFLQTDGTGALSTGYARLVATGPLGGTILFSQLDSGGQTVAESGVGASAPGTRFSVPVIYGKDSADTGMAFANSSAQSMEVLLTLRSSAGTALATQRALLGPGQHLPRFATEFFTSLANQQEFFGSIECAAPVPIAAVALKVQGRLITTFPVIEIH